MNTPFPYFGGKTRIAGDVWRRFGDPAYYYEPFAGSLAVLLNRPTIGRYEHVGDLDGMIVNFLRAVKADPAMVARHADYPAVSIDLEARIQWLNRRGGVLCQELLADPDYYDAKCAGWYAWERSVRILGGGKALKLGRNAGVRRSGQTVEDYFASLASRLKQVTVFQGDWMRLARAALRESKNAACAIFLDPPYTAGSGRQSNLYDQDSQKVGHYVQRWAVEAASPSLRIALCGFEDEYDMPRNWIEMPWKSQYSGVKERVWFSPHCLEV
jgi:hypothetical protein